MSEPLPSAWSRVFVRETAFGVLVAVALPTFRIPAEGASPEVLAQLWPEEQDLARSLRGRRQQEFAGGRLAARLALEAVGGARGPVLTGTHGGPLAPAGVVVSVSHKNELVLALAARDEGQSLGVDLEGDGAEHASIAPRVLRPEELEAVEAAPPQDRWRAVLERFAVKEAIYKALAPRLGRFIGFQEARVDLDGRGGAIIALSLTGGEAVPPLEAALQWLDDARVVAFVRARWTRSPA